MGRSRNLSTIDASPSPSGDGFMKAASSSSVSSTITPTMLKVSMLLELLLAIFTISISGPAGIVMVEGALDATEAAEISREIRIHFRASGMNWVSPKMIKEIDLATNTKPIFYLFTARSCTDCRILMQEFVDLMDHSMLSQLSAQFLAVLVLDDYALQFGEEFSPGGFDAIPRIIFASPNGTVRTDVTNPKSDKTTLYYYANAQEVVDMLQKVLHEHYSTRSSLLREVARTPGNSMKSPSSILEESVNGTNGGAKAYPSDLAFDLPS